MKNLSSKHIKSLLKPRNENSYKGTHGHAFLVVGNKGKMGAAVIATKACLRSGAGLVSVCVPEEERAILQIAIPEAMISLREQFALDEKTFSVYGVGSGLGTDEKAKKLLTEILSKATKPLVLDADALNIISANKKLFAKIPKGSILTPHPKEFDRLFGAHKTEDERRKTAIKTAKENGLVIVLKGHKTLVTAEESFLNTTGNAGLAKGGSGDALTGIITALVAQGYAPFTAAQIGVYIHGLAADICLQYQSEESMLITDVIECLGEAFKQVKK